MSDDSDIYADARFVRLLQDNRYDDEPTLVDPFVTWRQQKLSDPNSCLIGLAQSPAQCLLHLHSHYPFSCVIFNNFWRTSLIILPPSPYTPMDNDGWHVFHCSRTPLLKGAPLKQPAHLGVVGALRKMDLPDSLSDDGSCCLSANFTTSLIWLIRSNQCDAVAILVQNRQVELDKVWDFMDGVMHMVLHPEMARCLVTHGARKCVDSSNNAGWTPMHVAATHGRQEIVKLLATDGAANIRAADHQGKTVVHLAAENGHDTTVEWLVAKLDGEDLNTQDRNGFAPIHMAAKAGHALVVQALLTGGANVNAQTSSAARNWSVARCAAQEGHKKVMEVLIAHNVDLQVKDDNDETPLDVAVAYENQELVALLEAAQK